MKKKKKYNQFAVGIFAYNRPSHLKRLFFSISKYNFSNLYIFLDGPKNDLDKINQNEIMLMVKKYPGKIKLIKRNKNLGLKKSLVNGANYNGRRLLKDYVSAQVANNAGDTDINVHTIIFRLANHRGFVRNVSNTMNDSHDQIVKLYPLPANGIDSS